MAAFESSHGNGMDAGVDLEEMLQQMFGMNIRGGMPPGFGGAARPQKPRKGDDEEHPYQVTLEELYKGKTAKFASTKNIICSHCKGSGGKEKAKPKQCASCDGKGSLNHLYSKSRLIKIYRCQAGSETHLPWHGCPGDGDM
jgi:DnaJ family protein A protein 2